MDNLVSLFERTKEFFAKRMSQTSEAESAGTDNDRPETDRTSMVAVGESDNSLESGNNGERAFKAVRRNRTQSSLGTRSSGSQMTIETVEKSAAAKIFFEGYFDNLHRTPTNRYRRRVKLENNLEKMSISDSAKRQMRDDWLRRESSNMRRSRTKISMDSFVVVKTIGRGAFGTVKLVREKASKKLYAIKILPKMDVLLRRQEGHVKAERDFLIEAAGISQWIVKLDCTFHDDENLYFVMEYLPGGDFLTLLIHRDILDEETARFYTAEMVLAIEEVHNLGYIHRDVKPDNFLFTSSGHLRLSDFGLSTDNHWSHDAAFYDLHRSKTYNFAIMDANGHEKSTIPQMKASSSFHPGDKAAHRHDLYPPIAPEKPTISRRSSISSMMEPPSDEKILHWRQKNRREQAFSVVGTNNYIAPEVLSSSTQDKGHKGGGYGVGCDWWSLGVILFEMLYGYPPFVSSSRNSTKMKIMNFRKTLRFPERHPPVSDEARDLITRLLCDQETRLGYSRGKRPIPQDSSGSQESSQHGLSPSENEDIRAIKEHPFFRSINWDRLAEASAPFQPVLQDDLDTTYFDDQCEGSDSISAKRKQRLDNLDAETLAILEVRKDTTFTGFTHGGHDRPTWYRRISTPSLPEDLPEISRGNSKQKSNTVGFRAISPPPDNSMSNAKEGEITLELHSPQKYVSIIQQSANLVNRASLPHSVVIHESTGSDGGS